ncbi:MAG: hypothetical protein CMJ18_06820 [Phycisphaeraceae bacterium]|nr:hypothetical protein [Phycisphaeraceae bacterium]
MAEPEPRPRTFTFRAFAVGLACMILLGFWVLFHEVLSPQKGYLVNNNPPAGAVGVFLAAMVIASLLTCFYRSLRLSKAELIFVYAMLVTAAPFFSHFMWGRFLGLMISVPRSQNHMQLVDSYSEKLWPHGPHLVENRRFEQGLTPDMSASPVDRIQIVEVEKSQVGRTRGARLQGDSTLRIRIPRRRDGEEVLVPGERYTVTALFRTEGFESGSSLSVDLVTDGDERVPVTILRRDTLETVTRDDGSRTTVAVFTRPGGFQRAGEPNLKLPRALDDHLDLVLTMTGAGMATVTDIVFFNVEAVFRLHTGTSEVRESDLARVDPNERDALLVRPDDLGSPAGWIYTLKGYIPYRDWARPLFYWGSIFLAVFLATLGIAIVFRRQWAEHERFSFPLIRLPQLLLEEKEENGRTVRPLFRSKAFRIGVVVSVAYALLKGLGVYIPGLPDPSVEVALYEFFTDPATRAFFRGNGAGVFMIVPLILAIAFFIDLDMLLSIVLFYWICKIPYYFGELFGWRQIKGAVDRFPFGHEQHIGAFLGLALVVLWISRRHLSSVWRTVLGRPGGADDASEAMSYRMALVMILASVAYFAAWGAMTGVGWGSALILFTFLVVCALATSRVRAECGLPGASFMVPMHSALIFMLMGGVFAFGTEVLLLAFLMGVLVRYLWLMFAPTQVEMLQLAHTERVSARGVKWALIAGLAGGVLIGGYVHLVWCYGEGGDRIPRMARGLNTNLEKYLAKSVSEADTAVRSAAATGGDPAAVSYRGAQAAVGVGAVVTMALYALRTYFVGFWLHPLGYVLANSLIIDSIYGSLLVAWLIKWLALKVSGPRSIRDWFNPFFAGVFVGSVGALGFWDVVALILLATGSGAVAG